jgi:hypothetical protein
MAGSCEHGNEPTGFIKFLDQVSVLLASQEGLCSMELVSWALFYTVHRLLAVQCWCHVK